MAEARLDGLSAGELARLLDLPAVLLFDCVTSTHLVEYMLTVIDVSV